MELGFLDMLSGSPADVIPDLEKGPLRPSKCVKWEFLFPTANFKDKQISGSLDLTEIVYHDGYHLRI